MVAQSVYMLCVHSPQHSSSEGHLTLSALLRYLFSCIPLLNGEGKIVYQARSCVSPVTADVTPTLRPASLH